MVKTSPSEGHVGLALLIDGSASMGAGEGSKFRHAQELAALLGTVGAARLRRDRGRRPRRRRRPAGARLAAPHLVPELVADLAALPPRHPHRPHRQPPRAPPRQRLRRPRGARLRRPGRARPTLGPALGELAASGAAGDPRPRRRPGRAGAAGGADRAARCGDAASGSWSS